MFKHLNEASKSHPVKVILTTGDELCVHEVLSALNDNSGVTVKPCDGTEHDITISEIKEIDG